MSTMGRPPKYKTPEAMQDKIDEYFDMDSIQHTISGLTYHLGFCDRQSFYEYEKKKDFTYTIKRARSRIEIHYEEVLLSKNTTGAIFALKNLGWSDKTETEISGQLDTVQYYAPKKDDSK